MGYQLRIKINTLTVLLAINVVIFLLTLLIQFHGFDEKLFFLFGGEITSRIFQGDLWLLVTFNFFHLDILHFALNIYALYRIGEIVNNFYGGRKLFFTYIIGGIAGALLSYIISLPAFLGSSSDMLSLGASGSIMGLIGLLLGGSLRKYRYGNELPFRPVDILIFVLPTFILGLSPELNINNWAHIGGFAAGTVLGLLFSHSFGNVESRRERIVSNIVYYICIGILLLSYLALLVNAYRMIFLNA